MKLLPNDRVVPPYAAQRVAGMMRPGESRLLFQVARDHVPAGSHCVDAGAFLGRSAALIAAGLSERPDRDGFLKSVHSYDLFLNNSDFYDKQLLGTVPEGGSFLKPYLSNTRDYADFINVYPGDFCGYRWCGARIGLFFCDISKTFDLETHVWQEFMPHFIPGETLFIQQDFVHVRAPFTHVVLGQLEEMFDFIAIDTPSLLMRFRQAPSAQVLQRALDVWTGSDADARAASIDRVLARIEPIGHEEATASVRLVKCVVLCGDGRTGDARAELEAVRRDHPIKDKFYLARERYVEDLLAGA